MKTGQVRRILLRAAVAIGVMMWLPGSLLPVSAGNATAYTYTISQDEEWMVTQDAYLVSRVLMREHAMTSPRDLFVKENRLYLADTGASRVLIYQLDTGDCREIGERRCLPRSAFSWIRTTSFMWPITALAPL